MNSPHLTLLSSRQLFLTLCIFLSIAQGSAFWAGLGSAVGRTARLLMMSNDKLSFGNKMDIRVRLPTRDLGLAEGFMSCPHLIVETAYDHSRYTKVHEGTYIIRFAQIPIPGIDTVIPEIEVDFLTRNSSIQMQSKSCVLKGGPIVRDTRFLQSFKINLTGQLSIDHSKPSADGSLLAVGQVVYAVQGEKPMLLRAAPSFILDGTINFIQNRVADFVMKQFSKKLLRAFQVYAQAPHTHRPTHSQPLHALHHDPHQL